MYRVERSRGSFRCRFNGCSTSPYPQIEYISSRTRRKKPLKTKPNTKIFFPFAIYLWTQEQCVCVRVMLTRARIYDRFVTLSEAGESQEDDTNIIRLQIWTLPVLRIYWSFDCFFDSRCDSHCERSFNAFLIGYISWRVHMDLIQFPHLHQEPTLCQPLPYGIH